MTMLPFLASLVAFLLFALATDRHHRSIFGRPCQPRRALALRRAGWVLVLVALLTAVFVWGTVVGPIAWVGTAMAGAAATFCLINFGPSQRS